MKNNPFKLAFGLILSLVLMMGASGVRPGPTGGGGGNLATMAGRLPVSKINATGTPSASTYLRGDGAWASVSAGESWQSATQASNGNTLTLTLSPTGDVFEIVGQITSASASSATEIEFNGSTGGHTYRHHFSGGVDTNAGGYFPPGVVGSGVTVYFHGYVQRTGTTIHADLTVSLPASSLSHSVVYKAITGATAITSFRFLSNQASGIGAGSFVKARKVA